jgi:poly-gamma-glutamate synthesis protein (capsule biosynthesis protein)
LTIPITAVGDATAIAEIDASVPFFTNRDTTKLTHVAMTGVTALVRATASQMENYGITWPGEEVADLLRSADIAHISNEVSFDADCPYPNPIGGTSFCSDDRYIELLEFIGTDVIELTGNHLNDYGLDNLGRSMELYASKGWQTFGGGRDLAEASKPLIIEHNGNTIAFVGCNSFGPVYAWAGDDSAGSNPCDGSLEGQIAQLSAENDVVIATLQYAEFYHYAPTADQIVDFRALAEAGADAVSGSQGHHAQGFDFYNDAFIHYGLGNLFFDQMDMLGTRQTFIDNYFIYDGKLISVDLYTGLIENYARPRTMTPEERAQALESLFQASGW